MTRLKLSDIADEKPVRLTIELPAPLHRELLAYAAAVNGGAAAGAPAAAAPVRKMAPSPALQIIGKMKDTLAGRAVGILIAGRTVGLT